MEFSFKSGGFEWYNLKKEVNSHENHAFIHTSPHFTDILYS